MRATIRRAIDAHKAQREENGEAGFSLIELIIVVVILGILAAIAIPIFMNIQADAQENSLKAIAANGATQAAAAIAQGETIDTTFFDNLEEGDVNVGWADDTAPTNIDEICVTATQGVDTATTQEAGPGCTE